MKYRYANIMIIFVFLNKIKDKKSTLNENETKEQKYVIFQITMELQYIHQWAFRMLLTHLWQKVYLWLANVPIVSRTVSLKFFMATSFLIASHKGSDDGLMHERQSKPAFLNSASWLKRPAKSNVGMCMAEALRITP